MEVTVKLHSAQRQLELFGPADSHLRLLRQFLGVQLTARKANLIITGKEKDVDKAVKVIDKMQKRLSKRGSLTAEDVTAFISRDSAPEALESTGAVTVYSHKKVIEP